MISIINRCRYLLLSLCFIGFDIQAIDIFQSVQINDKKAIAKWLKSKPDVYVLNNQGQSLLHTAVQVGNHSFVKKLLKKNIDVNLIDQHGKTALDYAVELRREHLVILLVKNYAKVSTFSNLDTVKSIIEKKNSHVSFISKVLLFPLSVLKIVSIIAIVVGIPLGIVLAFTVDPIFLLVGGFGCISLIASFVYTAPFSLAGVLVRQSTLPIDEQALCLRDCSTMQRLTY